MMTDSFSPRIKQIQLLCLTILGIREAHKSNPLPIQLLLQKR